MNDSTTGLTSGERVGSAILSRAAPRRGYGLRSAAPVRARDRDRSLRRALAVFLVAFAALLAAPPDAAAQTEVPADWTLIPSGLGAGDSFRLLIVTSTRQTAESTTIGDYDTVVPGRCFQQRSCGHSKLFRKFQNAGLYLNYRCGHEYKHGKQ